MSSTAICVFPHPVPKYTTMFCSTAFLLSISWYPLALVLGSLEAGSEALHLNAPASFSSSSSCVLSGEVESAMASADLGTWVAGTSAFN